MGLYEWYYTIRTMTSVTDPWSIFGRFVVDSWSIFGRFVVDSWSILSRFVVDPFAVRSRSRHACRCLTNIPYRVVHDIGARVHWQGAGVECR